MYYLKPDAVKIFPAQNAMLVQVSDSAHVLLCSASFDQVAFTVQTFVHLEFRSYGVVRRNILLISFISSLNPSIFCSSIPNFSIFNLTSRIFMPRSLSLSNDCRSFVIILFAMIGKT